MAEYFSFQAALCFSLAHVLIRRGLLHSSALTGSFISLSTSAIVLWLLVPFFVPLQAFWNWDLLYFVAAGFFAPGIGRTLSYLGIERIGVARSVPIVNSSPIFASVFAVIFLGEVWVLQNIVGTLLVIGGVIILSTIKPVQGDWRKIDVIFPILGALAFGISTTLRKAGLTELNIPLLAAATTATTAVLVSFVLVQFQGGLRTLKIDRSSFAWLFTASLFNTAAMLSVFYALSFGRVVVVEPLVNCNPLLSILLTAMFLKEVEKLSLRILLGAVLTVAGTILVATVN